MRLINNLDIPVRYSFGDPLVELKPKEFRFVPETCRTLTIQPMDKEYQISVDQLYSFFKDENSIENIVLADSDHYIPNSLFIKSNWQDNMDFLNFIYQNNSGFSNKIFTPKFDLTKYSLDNIVEAITPDTNIIIAKITKITNPNSGNMWWFLVLLVLIIVIITALALSCLIHD